jgi:hypothetical protein
MVKNTVSTLHRQFLKLHLQQTNPLCPGVTGTISFNTQHEIMHNNGQIYFLLQFTAIDTAKG